MISQSLFAVEYADTDTCPVGPTCQDGGHPSGDKDLDRPTCKGDHNTHILTNINTCKHTTYTVYVSMSTHFHNGQVCGRVGRIKRFET